MNDHTAVTKSEPKPPVVSGGGLAAIVPQSLDEAFRLSQALARGGDMVPKHFQGQPEQIMAAVMRGMEIGLAPMQALSNIAVINGRASLWGDALPALMQRAGHQLDCEVTGEGEAMVATATLLRGDNGQKVVRTFSVADAKKANLWGKQGPWQTYPKRMLAMRARSWAVRDGASDALMGLQVAEEMQDTPRMRDVTPKETAFTRLADQARGKIEPEQPATPSETAAEAEVEAQEAEVVDPPKSPLSDEEIKADAFPGSDAFNHGVDAFQSGKPEGDCPYDVAEARQEAIDWIGGWRQARRAAK